MPDTPYKPIYSISSIGYCPKVLSAQRLKYKPTPQPKRLAMSQDEGKMHEEFIVKHLEEEGLSIERGGQCLKCEKLGYDRKGIHLEWSFANFMLTGHMDGLVLADRDGIYFPELSQPNRKERPVCEIKTRSQAEYDRWLRQKWGGFTDNAYQLTAYMVLNRMIHDFNSNKHMLDPNYFTRLDQLGKTLQSLFVVKNRNTGEMHEFVQIGTPINFTDILSKIDSIEYYVGRGELFPEEPNWGSPRCSEYCLFKYLCTLDTKEDIQKYIESDEFTRYSKMWLDGTSMVEQGQSMVDEAELKLKSFAKAQSKDGIERFSFSTGLVDVTGYPVKAYMKPASFIQEGWRCSIKPTKKDKSNG